MQSINVTLPLDSRNTSPVLMKREDETLDNKTSRLASELEKLKNSEITKFSSNGGTSKRSVVLDKRPMNSSFYSSGVFKDLNPIYRSRDLKPKY